MGAPVSGYFFQSGGDLVIAKAENILPNLGVTCSCDWSGNHSADLSGGRLP